MTDLKKVASRIVARCGQYIATFGLIHGVRLLLWIKVIPVLLKLFNSNPGKHITVRIPQVRSPITFRLNTSDIPTFEQVFLEHQYSDSPCRTKIKFIIDGGANVGYASLYFANRYPEARIIAVEPEPSNFGCLNTNVRTYKNITTIQAAIWPESAPLRITNPDEQKYAFQVGAQGRASEMNVRGITINELLERSKAEEIDILKLDVEGAEENIFSFNYENWLDKVDTLYIELHDWLKPGSSENFLSATARYNFATAQRGELTILTRRTEVDVPSSLP